jgi:hypothetical protein
MENFGFIVDDFDIILRCKQEMEKGKPVRIPLLSDRLILIKAVVHGPLWIGTTALISGTFMS